MTFLLAHNAQKKASATELRNLWAEARHGDQLQWGLICHLRANAAPANTYRIGYFQPVSTVIITVFEMDLS